MGKSFANNQGNGEFNLLMILFLFICLFVIGRNIYAGGEKKCDFILKAATPEKTTGYNVSCKGAADGKAVIIVDGASNFKAEWKGDNFFAEGKEINSIPAGKYSVTVTDEKGCSLTDSVTLIEPPAFRVTEITYPTRKGEKLGEANVFAEGGTGPYRYEWNTIPVQHGNTATGLTEGQYTVKITDGMGCSLKHSVIIPTTDLSGARR